MSKGVKIFVIVVVIIAVLIGLFSYFGNKSPVIPATDLSTSPSSQGAVVIPGGTTGDPSQVTSSQFSALLSSVNSINLDTSIFSNPAYEALRDYPVSLGTAVVGRINPFAPLGTDAATGTTVATLQVQTLAPGKITSTSSEFGALVTVNNTSPVSVVFEYGPTDALGSATAPITVAKSGTALFTMKGLSHATTYYVQAIAVQGSATATSNTMSFTTLP